MLRFTKRSEYGLMALAYLGDRGREYVSVREIVEVINVPRRLLAEVLKSLSQAKLVEAIRGPGGGYRLRHRPEEMKLAEVIAVLEGPLQMADCTNGGNCDREPVCIISSGIGRVADHIQNVLHQYTLADISSLKPQVKV